MTILPSTISGQTYTPTMMSLGFPGGTIPVSGHYSGNRHICAMISALVAGMARGERISLAAGVLLTSLSRPMAGFFGASGGCFQVRSGRCRSQSLRNIIVPKTATFRVTSFMDLKCKPKPPPRVKMCQRCHRIMAIDAVRCPQCLCEEFDFLWAIF